MLTTHPPVLSGIVTAADAPTRRDGIVLVFAEDETRWRHPQGRYLSITRTNAHGHYRVDALPAGRYLAVALSSADTGTITDPATLTQLRRHAVPLELRHGEETSLNLRLASP